MGNCGSSPVRAQPAADNRSNKSDASKANNYATSGGGGGTAANAPPPASNNAAPAAAAEAPPAAAPPQKNTSGGRLTVIVERAENLPNTDVISKPDPYVTVALMRASLHAAAGSAPNHHAAVPVATHKTEVCDSTLAPVWKQGRFQFIVGDTATDFLVFTVQDKQAIGADPLMGTYRMALDSLPKGIVKECKAVHLANCKTQGSLTFRLLAHDFGVQLSSGAAAPAANSQANAGLGSSSTDVTVDLAASASGSGSGSGGGSNQFKAQSPLQGVVVQLVPRHNDQSVVLDVDGGSADKGARVLAWSATGTPNQLWRINCRADGSVSFHPTHAQHMALDIVEPNQPCGIWTHQEHRVNQGFFLEPADAAADNAAASVAAAQLPDRVYFLRSAAGGPGGASLYLDVDVSAGGGRGSVATTWRKNGKPNQQFLLRTVA